MMGGMNPRLLPDLLVFLEVARSGSISTAARRLHTVQTNVSARMQKLEAALGSELLIRTSHGIDLTSAGEALLPVARRLDSLLGQLGQTFPKSNVRPPALIRIGSLETFAATHLANLIASYRKSDPHPEFAITSGSSRSLIQTLQRNELDFAFVSHPVTVESIRTEFTLKEELVLFAPEKDKHKLNPKHWPADCDLPLIVQRQACSYSERFLSYLISHDWRIPRTIEAGSIEALLGLVEQGLGFGIAPRSLIDGRARRIRVISLTALGPSRWVNIHLLSNQAGWSRTLQRFVEHCRTTTEILFSSNHRVGQRPNLLH
jgi:DNA-binding transcriptional LysR family regulator